MLFIVNHRKGSNHYWAFEADSGRTVPQPGWTPVAMVEAEDMRGAIQEYFRRMEPQTSVTEIEEREANAEIARLEAENAELRQLIKDTELTHLKNMRIEHDVFSIVAGKLRAAKERIKELEAAELAQWGQTHA